MSPAAAPRRQPVFGPEPWASVGGREWSHWDLWYCLVAVLDHGGGLDGLEAVFVAGLKGPLWGRDAIEAKLSHLTDLRTRLSEARLSPAGLIPPDAGVDRGLVSKARRKLSGRGLESRAMTPAMVDTPRAQHPPGPHGPLGSLPGRSGPLLPVVSAPRRGEAPRLEGPELRGGPPPG